MGYPKINWFFIHVAFYIAIQLASYGMSHVCLHVHVLRIIIILLNLNSQINYIKIFKMTREKERGEMTKGE